MTMHIFEGDKVKHKFLDVCTTSGQEARTAKVIFGKMDAVLSQHNILWKTCVSIRR